MKSFILLAFIAMISIAAANEGNVTTFLEQRLCAAVLPSYTCADLGLNAEQYAICLNAAHTVENLTSVNGTKVLEECKIFDIFAANASSNEHINAYNHYFNCFFSSKVLRPAYASKPFFEKIYVPRFINCAGY